MRRPPANAPQRTDAAQTQGGDENAGGEAGILCSRTSLASRIGRRVLTRWRPLDRRSAYAKALPPTFQTATPAANDATRGARSSMTLASAFVAHHDAPVIDEPAQGGGASQWKSSVSTPV
jgi:hypothetical protein